MMTPLPMPCSICGPCCWCAEVESRAEELAHVVGNFGLPFTSTLVFEVTATLTMAGVTRAARVSMALSSASSALTLLSSSGAALGADAAAFATTGLAV